MIENYVIARDYVEVPIGPGQRVDKVVRQKLELPPAIWVARLEARGLLACNFQLPLRDVDANGLHSEALVMGVSCNSPDPGTGAAAGIENAESRHTGRAQLLDRLADRLPDNRVSVRETTRPFGWIFVSLAVGITTVLIADVIVSTGDGTWGSWVYSPGSSRTRPESVGVQTWHGCALCLFQFKKAIVASRAARRTQKILLGA
jgi:hypothetical protein